MVVEFDKSFLKSITKIKNPKLFARIEKIIWAFELAKSLNEIPNVKKLSGFSNYFRIKSGDYRIGFELINNETIRFILVAHRKDIYKKFP
jgi:mRNA interferase RelE/StbE